MGQFLYVFYLPFLKSDEIESSESVEQCIGASEQSFMHGAPKEDYVCCDPLVNFNFGGSRLSDA